MFIHVSIVRFAYFKKTENQLSFQKKKISNMINFVKQKEI